MDSAFDPDRWYSSHAVEYAHTWAGASTAAVTRFCTRLSPGAVVLDVACGPGRDLVAGQSSGVCMVGSDLADGMVCLAAGVHPRVVRASFLSLPYATASIDAVWARAAVVHCDDDALDAAVAEFARVLRPGGWLAVDAKDADPSVGPDGVDRQGRWFALRTVDELAAVVRVHGFAVSELRVDPDDARPGVRWARCLAQATPRPDLPAS